MDGDSGCGHGWCWCWCWLWLSFIFTSSTLALRGRVGPLLLLRSNLRFTAGGVMTESGGELAQNISPSFIHQPRRRVSSLLCSPAHALTGSGVSQPGFTFLDCSIHDLNRFGVQVFDFLLNSCSDSKNTFQLVSSCQSGSGEMREWGSIHPRPSSDVHVVSSALFSNTSKTASFFQQS